MQERQAKSRRTPRTPPFDIFNVPTLEEAERETPVHSGRQHRDRVYVAETAVLRRINVQVRCSSLMTETSSQKLLSVLLTTSFE